MTGKNGVIARVSARGNLLRDYFVALLLVMTSRPDVIPDLIGYPGNKKSSCADVVRWILGSSPRMTGKNGVIASLIRRGNLLRDYFVALLLAMTSRPDVIPDLIGYPGNKKSSCADVVRWISHQVGNDRLISCFDWILGSSPRMTGKNGVIASLIRRGNL